MPRVEYITMKIYVCRQGSGLYSIYLSMWEDIWKSCGFDHQTTMAMQTQIWLHCRYFVTRFLFAFLNPTANWWQRRPYVCWVVMWRRAADEFYPRLLLNEQMVRKNASNAGSGVSLLTMPGLTAFNAAHETERRKQLEVSCPSWTMIHSWSYRTVSLPVSLRFRL